MLLATVSNGEEFLSPYCFTKSGVGLRVKINNPEINLMAGEII